MECKQNLVTMVYCMGYEQHSTLNFPWYWREGEPILNRHTQIVALQVLYKPGFWRLIREIAS